MNMECPEVVELLSAYYDGELSPECAAAVSEHVARCPRCASELAAFRKMSELTAQLDQPQPARRVWRTIEQQLDQPTPNVTTRQRNRRRRIVALVAAIIVVALIAPWAIHQGWHAIEDHHLKTTFGEFLAELEQSPDKAHEHLIQHYSGREVNFEDATRALRYRPAAADGLPMDYELTHANLLKMPCCLCLKTCYRRKAGGTLCVFEHDEDQPAWFGDRPVSSVMCCGKPTRIVRVHSSLAATWAHQQRFITVIGAKDQEEVSRLVAHIEQLPVP